MSLSMNYPSHEDRSLAELFCKYNVGVEQSPRGQCISADLYADEFHMIYRVFVHKNKSILNFIDKKQNKQIRSQYNLENHRQAFKLFTIAHKNGYNEIVSTLGEITPANRIKME